MSPNSKLFDGMVLFAEVVKSGSFTAAAQKSNHSTSYISKEINRLEDRLGVRLLNRTTRTIGLTPEGKEYFEHCEQLIEGAVNAQQRINQQFDEPHGTLKISAPVSFGVSQLRSVLARYLVRYPKVKLDIDLSDRFVDIVADGFDCVIRASDQLENSSLIARKITQSSGITIASPEYLKQFGTPTHPSELKNHQCISYSLSNSPFVWVYESNHGEQCEVKITPKVMCNNAELELEMVLMHQGITRLPRFCISDHNMKKLVTLFPNFREFEININVIYASRKHLSAKVRSFIDFLINEFIVKK